MTDTATEDTPKVNCIFVSEKEAEFLLKLRKQKFCGSSTHIDSSSYQQYKKHELILSKGNGVHRVTTLNLEIVSKIRFLKHTYDGRFARARFAQLPVEELPTRSWEDDLREIAGDAVPVMPLQEPSIDVDALIAALRRRLSGATDEALLEFIMNSLPPGAPLYREAEREARLHSMMTAGEQKRDIETNRNRGGLGDLATFVEPLVKALQVYLAYITR